MKIFKTLLSIIGLLILALIVAIILLVIFVDPNKLKPMITKEVQKKTNYQLLIDGNLSWSFFPRLGIKMDKVTVAAPEQSKPFLILTGATLGMDVMQVIKGQEGLQGDINMSEVIFSNMKADHVHAHLTFENNQLNIKPLTASLYNGSLTAEGQGDALMATPHWNVTARLQDVSLKALLSDVTPSSKITFSGEADVKLKLETRGKAKEDVMQNLNGTAEFSVASGVLEGVNINYFIQTADALMHKQPVPAMVGGNETTFDHLSGFAKIGSGIATMNDLVISSSAFVTKGSGDINLVAQSLDYALVITPQKTQTDWLIPLLISGDLQSPSVRIDMVKIQEALAKEQLEKVKGKVQEELKKIPGKADELIQNLLGR